jgi:UDPglucose--hexose-1-phosphate uridylyltransferase
MPSYDTPHRRFNPLTAEWVLVSPHRARRPWLGQVEKAPVADIPAYDPECYLCPGNIRAGGVQNPPYESTFVFDNDFPALLPPPASPAGGGSSAASDVFLAEPVSGICRVVCFSPRHDLTLPELSQAQVEAVVRAWTEQTRLMGEVAGIHYVQVFENKGEMMGCSNPHPHSQIWSTSHLPDEPAKELAALAAYQRQHGGCLLCRTVQAELEAGERVIAGNDHFVALAPYWAVWPFETLVIARSHLGSLTDLSPAQLSGLAEILHQVTVRYDNLFEISFPYSMGFHQAPVEGGSYPECHLHAHFYPPLLRSATVRKFMVGFEMMAMPQRDLTPETAAERLRAASAIHYRQPGDRAGFGA